MEGCLPPTSPLPPTPPLLPQHACTYQMRAVQGVVWGLGSSARKALTPKHRHTPSTFTHRHKHTDTKHIHTHTHTHTRTQHIHTHTHTDTQSTTNKPNKLTNKQQEAGHAGCALHASPVQHNTRPGPLTSAWARVSTVIKDQSVTGTANAPWPPRVS